MQINRERAALMGEETRRILAKRAYTNGDGAAVELGAPLDLAVAGARSYPAEHALPAEHPGPHQTVISVRNESTLAASRRLAGEGKGPAALNFAANAGVVLERDRARRAEVRATMVRRVGRVLALGALHGHAALVLGAWGCGVFRNDPVEVAELFATALAGPFRGAFVEVVFAVLDSSPERRFIGPFEQAFAG